MDQSLFVGGFERFGRLPAQPDDLRFRQSSGRQHLRERDARDVLHGQEVHISLGVEVVDRRDVGVIEPGQGYRFLAEARPCLVIGKRSGGKDFDGDVPVQAFVPGPIDDSHSPGADLLDDPIVS